MPGQTWRDNGHKAQKRHLPREPCLQQGRPIVATISANSASEAHRLAVDATRCAVRAAHDEFDQSTETGIYTLQNYSNTRVRLPVDLE
eukprot:COSAG02_NODE_3503_length_6644_cov_3.803820_2_plen_88_part_00